MSDKDEAPDLAADIDQNIGRNLKQLREARGMSQADLARLVGEAGVRGFHQTTIARIESGQRALRASEAIAVSRVLEVNFESLAENRSNALVRSFMKMVGDKSKEFDEALSGLIHARLLAAQHLDRAVPYGAEGVASAEDVLRSGISSHLYYGLESRIVSASPQERLDTAIYNVTRQPGAAYDRPRGAQHKQRVEFIFDEYLGEEGEDDQHPAEA